MDQLGVRVPEGYIEFLRMIDGCYVSSEQFFATRDRPCIRNVRGRLVEAYKIDDLVEFNRCCRIDFGIASDVIVVGDGTLDYFRGWSVESGDWFLLEQDGGGYRAKIYLTFPEMLADSLQDGGIDTRGIMPASFEYFSLDAKG